MSEMIHQEPAWRLVDRLRNREISSVELTQLYIDRIERLDGDINAVVVRTFENALEEAARADQSLSRGQDLGPLHGIPMTIKESYVMVDTASTWGLESQKNNVSPTDGLTVSRFRQAGAHFLGKTNVPKNLEDFQSYNALYGVTNNPWDRSRTPGGSSGGSAAALAAGFSALEAGSDIGGSIRTPAHFCGLFGHKPTWGIVPQSGHELMPGVPDSDLSVCGPLARHALDLKTALEIMAGPTARDACGWQLSLPEPGFKHLKDLKVAIWANDELAPVSAETEQRVMEIAELLTGLGATVSDTARPDFDLPKASMTYQSLLTAVMSAAQPAEYIQQVREQVDGLDARDGSPAAVIARATVMMHRDWIRHNFRREKLRAAWDSFFEDWDILIAPQFCTPAFHHDHRAFGERSFVVNGEARPYFEPTFWSGLAIASYLPSTVFPTGLSEEGLPVGLQAISGPYRDYSTIEFAHQICREAGGYQAPPDYLT